MSAGPTDEGRGEWRDSSGMRLADYPHPSLAVDVAILTVLPARVASTGDEVDERGELAVVVHRRSLEEHVPGSGSAHGRWALPGAFVHIDERLRDAAFRAVSGKCGPIERLEPHQLQVFDDLDRDPRGRVISVAFWDVVPYDDVAGLLAERNAVEARPVGSDPHRSLPDLAFDHRRIVELAVGALRRRYLREPDPFRLLGTGSFTLLQLRHLHEAIAGHALQKDTFRRRMEPDLVAKGRTTSGTRGRPAQLYGRRG